MEAGIPGRKNSDTPTGKMANRSAAASQRPSALKEQAVEALLGEDYLRRSNRGVLGRFQPPERKAWDLFSKVGHLPAPKDMVCFLQWMRENMQVQDDRPVPAMTRIDRDSSKMNAERVLEALRPIIKDSINFSLRTAGAFSKVSSLIAIPLTSAGLTESLMGNQAVLYEGTSMHLPFNEHHLLFKAGFASMRDMYVR